MVAPKVDASATLSPLPPQIHRGLSIITTFAFISAISSAVLLTYLIHRLVTSSQHGFCRVNQYVALLLNLIAADLAQALGFVLSVEWVSGNSIKAGTATCWTQGWFLNAGDVGSCIFTFVMAIHLFIDIIFDKRLEYKFFLLLITALWAFDFALATIGVIIHPHDFYMRAGMWCWINEDYMDFRVWVHYAWILIGEFGVVTLYAILIIIMWRRVRSFFYSTSDLRQRARCAVKSVVAYPIIHVLCTLPAVIARLKLMVGESVGYVELTFVGVMMVSNGWMDVLLYTVTRRSLIFGPAVPDDDVYTLETFTRFKSAEEDLPRCSRSISAEMKEFETIGRPSMVQLKAHMSRNIYLEENPNSPPETQQSTSSSETRCQSSFNRTARLPDCDLDYHAM